MLWQAPEDMVWRAASSLHSISSSLAQLLCITLAFHSTRGEAVGWFGTESLKELSSLVAWLCGVGYF